MLGSVIKQIVKSRKSNTWLALELLLVFCLLWYMVDYFFVLGCNYSIPSYRNLDNTYYIKMGTLPQSHAEYEEAESDSVSQMNNIHRVIDRIRQCDGVEAIGLSYSPFSLPGSGNYIGNDFCNPQDTTVTASFQSFPILTEGDYFKAFRHTTNEGLKPVSMADYDWTTPRSVVISRRLEKQLFPESQALGKEIMHPQEKTTYLVKGVVDDVKRFGYERPQGVIFFLQRMDADNPRMPILMIRVKEGVPASDFIAGFRRNMSGELRIGNYYLKSIISFNNLEQNTNDSFGITNNIRIRVAMMLFFLLNILLCVIGTFWYRVNLRREEIGIRRAMGSSGRGIIRLLLLEGVCLLTMVSLVAMFVEAQFVYAGLIDTLGYRADSIGDFLPDHTAVRFAITNLLTWALMTCIVSAGIWFPARAAAKLKPVEALRDE